MQRIWNHITYDGRGEADDISNYFPVWLPVIGYGCKNIYLVGVSSYLFLWAFLRIFSYSIKLASNSVQLAFECIRYSIILAKLLQSLSVQQDYHIRAFHRVGCSENKCQILYQFNCFASLSWAIATEAMKLKFILLKFITWECLCLGVKIMW